MNISIGSKLKMARTKKGLKQIEVCKLLDMPTSTLSNYERDEREPDLTTLARLAELYETPIDYLIDINESRTRWERLVEFSSSVNVSEEDTQEGISDYEFEFLKDARKANFDFLKWQILTKEQKEMMFRIVRSVISEIDKDRKNN